MTKKFFCSYLNSLVELTFEYDKEGDILYINKCDTYAEQESEEIENLEVMFFSKRLLLNQWFEWPIKANFQLTLTV